MGHVLGLEDILRGSVRKEIMMQAFKIDLMALLVVAVVLGIGLTMALSHHAVASQVPAASEINTQSQLHTSANPVRSQFIKASQSARVVKLESRI